MAPSRLSRHETLFAATGIGVEAVLVAHFGLRTWVFDTAMQLGPVFYTALFSAALIVGVVLYRGGASLRLWGACAVTAVWAAFGFVVDIAAHIAWRSPINWPVFVAYVGLFLLAQMWFWWPLLKLRPWLWAVFGVLFVAATTLNAISHG